MYRKIEHSVALTDWLVRNNPETLGEIAKLLDSILVRLDSRRHLFASAISVVHFLVKAISDLISASVVIFLKMLI